MKTPTMRVDKLLGSLGYGSRTEMARMGKAGGIVQDGVPLAKCAALGILSGQPHGMTFNSE